MKLLPVITIFFLIVAFRPPQQNMDRKVYTERFMQKVGDKSMNWIEFKHDEKSISGIFYGFDKLSDGTPIYYKSEVKGLTIANSSIRFTLSSYMFSKSPFENGSRNKGFYIKEGMKTPALLKFPQNFSGTISSDSLKLKRSSLIYDSRFDELILIKVK